MMTSKKNNTEKLLIWLEEHPAISIKLLEEEAGIPSTTIAKAKGGREIPAKHWPVLVKTLKKYGLDSKMIVVNKEKQKH